MASGMKVWLALCLGGLAVVAVLLLPPGSADFVRRDAWQLMPAQLEAKRLDGRASRLDWQIRLLRTADSVRARLEEAHRQGHRELVTFFPQVADSEEAVEYRAMAAAHLDSLRGAPATPGPLVAVVFLEATWGSERGIPARATESTFAGTLEDGTPYCARVGWLGPSHELDRFVRPYYGGPLGLCRLWARLGPPGPHVARWLEAGGYHRVTSAERTGWQVDHPRPTPFGLDAAQYIRHEESRAVVARLGACVYESADCGGMVLATAPASDWAYREVKELTDLLTGAPYPPNLLVDRHFMAELEALEGEAAARAFWTSDLPPAEAFAEATGTELDAWTREWIRSLDLPFLDRPGPRLGARNAGLSLLTLLAAAGVGLALQHRRRVS